jgi:lipopolysaccharide transport system permease protein
MRGRCTAHRRQSFLAHSGAAVLELGEWRHLVSQLVRAELRRENARLHLGALWWVADPLLQMLVYTVLVSVIFARTLPDYPLFVLAALVPWKGLATTVTTGATAIIGNERVVKQVAFPRIVLPVARALAQAWHLAIALIVMIVLMFLVWPERVTGSLVWLPVIVAVQIILTLPIAIFLSCATVFFRDLANLMRHALRLALYVSPVLYGLDQALSRLPPPVADVYRLNPVAALLEAYRQVAYEGSPPNLEYLLLPLGLGLVLLGPAMAWFHACERRFGKRL